ncbi:MAG: lytic transglycosylase domain-containing protein [Sphingomicrobium sp.]
MRLITHAYRNLSLRAVGLAAIALGGAAPIQAQVIEIDNDGAARTYSKPTRFISGEDTSDLTPGVVVPMQTTDRFERAANAEGVDVHLLRAVAWTESRGRQNAISPKGALGIMQLMPGTAAELGVNPLDPDANVNGGARYLARQLTRFQSVPLALAAYNAGPGAVLRWGGIPPYAETQSYVAQILNRYKGVPVAILPKKIAAPVARAVNPMLIEVP